MKPSAMKPSQCRAARALLDWTQTELAVASSLGLSTVVDFERERRQVSEDAVTAIRTTLEKVGVEFSNGNSPTIRFKISGYPDLIYRQACLAAEEIVKGKSLDAFIPDRGDGGREFSIRDALLRASVQISGDFDDDAYSVFEKALKSKVPSKRVSECCKALLRACKATPDGA